MRAFSTWAILLPIITGSLSALLIIVGARLFYRGKGSGEMGCGKCGYAVRGASGLACPECGADLREVGIKPVTGDVRTYWAGRILLTMGGVLLAALIGLLLTVT